MHTLKYENMSFLTDIYLDYVLQTSAIHNLSMFLCV